MDRAGPARRLAFVRTYEVRMQPVSPAGERADWADCTRTVPPRPGRFLCAYVVDGPGMWTYDIAAAPLRSPTAVAGMSTFPIDAADSLTLSCWTCDDDRPCTVRLAVAAMLAGVVAVTTCVTVMSYCHRLIETTAAYLTVHGG